MIAPMTVAHVDQVVHVHQLSFPGFFLSFLGPHFLHLFYSAGVDYADSVAFVYLNGPRVVGLVFGVSTPSRFYRFLLRTHWLRFALAASGAALRRPSIIPHLLRAWLYPSQTSSQANSATLMSLGVDPALQGRGIGAQLVHAFLDAARARGVRCVDLTTDRKNNEGVNAFYQRQGFRCERTFVTPEGREMNEYVISL